MKAETLYEAWRQAFSPTHPSWAVALPEHRARWETLAQTLVAKRDDRGVVDLDENSSSCQCGHDDIFHGIGIATRCGHSGCSCDRYLPVSYRRLMTMYQAEVAARASEAHPPSDSGSATRDDAPDASSAKLARTTPLRERLSDERSSITRSFRLKYLHKDGTSDVMHFYFTAGVYPDGRPGEIFVKADKTGTLASGALDAVAVMASLLLQYGVPLDVITSKLRHTRYPPNQFTGDEEFPSCSSPLDLLAQWLEKKFGDR